jgi:long-chain acyl-CoA synthetase
VNLATIVESHPHDDPAIISAGNLTSYGELRAQVAAVRGGLSSMVQPGDRVAIVMASNWYFVVAYLAALGVGAVVVPLNPQSPAAELERELASVRPRVAIVGATSESAISELDLSSLGISHVLVPEGVNLDGARSFEDLLVCDPVPIVERDAEDYAVLMFTSGTAGSPKAACLTHGNLLSNLNQMQAYESGAARPTDVGLAVLPLFHIYGLNAMLGFMLYAGASVVLVQRFDPASALETIRERRVTVIGGVPPMFESWESLPLHEAMREDFSTVRLIASGASKLDPGLGKRFFERFGVRIGEGYGLTEASPVVTVADFDNPQFDNKLSGTIGIPLPGVTIRLVDDQGNDALVGDPGEIWVKGPNVFPGYWEDEEATARALSTDGWLQTGDIAVADGNGYLTIVDRGKDLIIVSGFNVFPNEVEGVLATHPGVSAVAVVGVAHPHTGESVKAFVVAKPDRMLEEDELIVFCSRQLARYKCPTKIMFVDQVPTGMGGKILRRELR